MALYVTSDDLAAIIGAASVTQLFDDRGAGIDDEGQFTKLATFASGIAKGILLQGFTAAQIDLLAEDDAVKQAVAGMLAGFAGRRRSEFLGADGKGRYDMFESASRQALVAMSKGATSIVAEQTAGRNNTLGGSSNATTPVRHIFAPSRTNPGGSGSF